MTNLFNISEAVNKEFLHFQNAAKHNFAFLNDFGYNLTKIESGQSENFLNYFFNMTFLNQETKINIDFSTEIIKGMKKAFPSLKDKDLPEVNSNIYCSIRDSKALMSINSFIEFKFPEISKTISKLNQLQ